MGMKKRKNRKRVLCIGHSTYDITIVMDFYPPEDKKYKVDTIIESGGGPSNNAAYLLAKWGTNTHYASTVGYDLYGRRIKKELEKIGVKTKLMELRKKFSTSVSYIIVNLSNGSRTVLGYTAADMKLNRKKIKMKPNIILVDGYEFDIAMRTLTENPKAIKVIDAGRASKETIELSKKVDYLVCSRDFAEQYTNQKIDIKDIKGLTSIYNTLVSEFNNIVVITLGEDGVLYKVDDTIKIMPPYKVEPKDTTGAGDIFHGAFVYGLCQNYNLEKTIKIASIAAALSVTKIGSKQSMPELEDVMKVYNRDAK